LPAPWFSRGDELYEIYLKQDLLIREGVVVWGALVQSNKLLLQPGRHDHPATCIWSEKPEMEAHPEVLTEIAARLFDLKGAKPVDHEERRYAAMLTDEKARGMGLKIPRTFAGPHHPITSTTVMVFRRHLPTNILMGSLVPLLTHYTTSAALIVPAKYWPRGLVRQWEQAYNQTAASDEAPRRGRPAVLTPAALAVARDMARDFRDPRDWYLRLQVRKRDSRGEPEAFAVYVDDRTSRYDLIYEQDGVQIAIDEQDLRDLRGAQVDYETKKGGKPGFSFVFP
jgi:Fe-S cluster assembly iron-binding protein IscA